MDHSSLLPQCREVIGEEIRVENQDQEGHRSLWEILQGPVPDTVRAESLAELETNDGFLNLLRFGEIEFAGRGQKARPQRHVNLNNCRDLRIGHRLKLSLQIVGKGFGFDSLRQRFPRGYQRRRRSRNVHHPFAHPPQRLVFEIEGFECRTPQVVPPFINLAGHRHLQAADDLGFQSGVLAELPLPPQPVLQVYLILNTSRYLKPWIVTRAALRSRCRQSF